MRTVYGRAMPAHCSLYFSPPQATRRLSCLKLADSAASGRPERVVLRLGPPGRPGAPHRLFCTCAPVLDYTGREVARVGLFAHGADDRRLTDFQRGVPRAGAADFGAARPPAGGVSTCAG